MLGVEYQRDLHGAGPRSTGRLAVQQMEEVPSERFAVGVHRDALAVAREVVPVEEHRACEASSAVGDVAGAGFAVVFGLGS